jgi:hypothetical protein
LPPSIDEAVLLFEKASKDVQHKDLKDFADKTVSALKEHKEIAHRLADKPGVKEGSDKDRDRDRSKEDRNK